MARKLRVQYPRAIYHVMIRGDLPSSNYGKASLPSSDYDKVSRREAIFEDDEDRQRLLHHRGQSRLAVPADQELLRI